MSDTMSETASRAERLLAPISAAVPCGDDLAYSPLSDEIRSARQADDPALAQGDWATALKVADWALVQRLCEQALARRGKDLQIAAWYVEALAWREGYAGLAFGLDLIGGLFDRYWDTLYPMVEDGDAGERIARLEWMDRQLGQTLRQLPLTATTQGGYTWYDYQASRAHDNRQRAGDRDASAADALSGERFDQSLAASGPGWANSQAAAIADARRAAAALETRLDLHLGRQAPPLSAIRQALEDCAIVLPHAASTAADTAPPPSPLPSPHAHCSSAPGHAIPAGNVQRLDRESAIRQLNEVAAWFRSHEPHSPVALLVERASRWATMSFEEWLQAVIKDGATLDQLHTLLEFSRQR